MITMEQFLKNNSEQEGVCIAVYGEKQYNEFMNIVKNNGYSDNDYYTADNFYKALIGEYTHFILLCYLQEDKTIEYMKFLLDKEPCYVDIEFIFYNEDEDDPVNCLIKPFVYLKREMRDLGLC